MTTKTCGKIGGLIRLRAATGRRIAVVGVKILMILTLLVGPAGAQTAWQVGTGNWSTGSNWNSGEPNAGVGAWVNNGGTAEITSGNNEAADYLHLGYDPGQSGLVDMTGGTLSVNSGTFGRKGNGTFGQSGGTVTVNGQVSVGDWGSGVGTYNLSGAGSVLDISSNLTIGWEGTGELNQSGGATTVGGDLYISRSAGSDGTYNISGGSLSAGLAFVGSSGPSGKLEASDTGTVNVDLLGVGWEPGSSGELTIGGTAQINVTSNNLIVGRKGSGTVTQTGGSVDATGFSVSLNSYGSAVGGANTALYDMSGGSLLADVLSIGEDGPGTFQAGGDAVVDVGLIKLGPEPGTSGQLYISGNAQVNVTNNHFIVGRKGSGTVTQTGGSVDATGFSVFLNSYGSAVGGTNTSLYDMSGGTLTADVLRIGEDAFGTFSASGGAIVNVGVLQLAPETVSSGQLNIAGAAQINVSSGATFGRKGNGTVDQTGGTVTIVGQVSIGDWASSTNAVYNLSGAGSVLDIGSDLTVGWDGTGELNISGGSLSAGLTYVGLNGSGTLSASGDGQVDVVLLGAGWEPGSSGELNISGTANVNVTGNNVLIGRKGSGTLTQTGGSLNVNGGGMYLNTYGSAVGGANTSLYQISGGSLDISSGNLVVAEDSPATLEVIGSTASINTGGDYTQKSGGTLRSVMDNGGPTKVAVSGATTINSGGEIDVDLSGGVALLTATAHELLGGGSSLSDNSTFSEALWLKSNVANNVVATMDPALMMGTLDAGTDYDEAGPFPGANAGYVELINALRPDLYLWLDVQTDADLDDLVDFMTAGGHTVTKLDGDPFELVMRFFPAADTSYFAWDFATFDALGGTTTLLTNVVVPEPSTWVLLAITLAFFGAYLRRRELR